MRARRPSVDGDASASPTVIATPAVRVRPGPPHRGTLECVAYPNRLRVIRRGESPRRPYVVGRHLRRLDGVVADPVVEEQSPDLPVSDPLPGHRLWR